jgi:putative membrane protein
MIALSDLPAINATLNFISAVLLFWGRYQIKRKRRPDIHRIIMIAALVSSALFLASYLIYHGNIGSKPYPHFDWTRPVYFTILIPHVILAGLMVPFILWAVYCAFRQRFDRHVRLVRWVWPVWMFVSVSGIIVYIMLYRL